MANTIFPFEKLGRRAAVILPAYLSCIGGLFALALVVYLFEPAPEDGNSDDGVIGSASDALWFVWVTFHMCPYGEIIPTHPVGKFVGMVCSGTGLLFLVSTCITAFVATTQRSGTAAEVLRATVVKSMHRVLPAYLLVAATALVVFGIFFDAADCVERDGQADISTYDAMFFSWNTFHHATYGDRYPGTTVGKVAAAFLQMLGFMFIPYALAIGLNEPTGGLIAEQAEGHFEAPAAAQEAPSAPAPGASIFG